MIHVDEIEGRRFDVALELFKEGKTLKFNEVELWFDQSEKAIHVRVPVTFDKRHDEDKAMRHFQHGAHVYSLLTIKSDDFRKFAASCQLRFSLIEDYGTGSVEICVLSNSKIVWR